MTEITEERTVVFNLGEFHTVVVAAIAVAIIMLAVVGGRSRIRDQRNGVHWIAPLIFGIAIFIWAEIVWDSASVIMYSTRSIGGVHEPMMNSIQANQFGIVATI